MSLEIPSFHTEMYSPWRATGEALHPHLWKGCIGDWNPAIGITGNTLFDLSGHGRHGTISLPEWYRQSGELGLKTDSVSDYVDITAPLYGARLSISVRFFSDKVGVTSEGIARNGSTFNPWGLQDPSDKNSLYFYFNGASIYALAPISAVPNAAWVNVVCNYDGSGSSNADKFQMWINGEKKSLTFAGTVPTSLNTGSSVRMGAGYGTQTFTGKLGYLRAYDRPILANEIIHHNEDPHAPYRVRRRRSYSVAAAPSGFLAAFASRSNVLIQPHVSS